MKYNVRSKMKYNIDAIPIYFNFHIFCSIYPRHELGSIINNLSILYFLVNITDLLDKTKIR